MSLLKASIEQEGIEEKVPRKPRKRPKKAS
jgi:hypothetical protein